MFVIAPSSFGHAGRVNRFGLSTEQFESVDRLRDRLDREDPGLQPFVPPGQLVGRYLGAGKERPPRAIFEDGKVRGRLDEDPVAPPARDFIVWHIPTVARRVESCSESPITRAP